MRPDEDDDIDMEPQPRGGASSLRHLHGMWSDTVRGSLMCIDARADPPRTVYCSGGMNRATGVYEHWRFDGLQFVWRFRWYSGEFTGYVVLQPEGPDTLVGGWWYERDVPPAMVARLPFVPGVNPCRWVRHREEWWWPDWAARALGLPWPITTADLPLGGTSEGRYRQRLVLWTGSHDGLSLWAAWARHRGWWLLHNLVAHPLLAFVRGPRAVAFHDWTSRRLNLGTGEGIGSPPPDVRRPLWWIVHNALSHVAIGVAPCKATFRWHDATARRMGVLGWV